MDRKFNIAVVGATGAVGEVILSLLAERCFPVAEIFVVASERSAGEQVLFQQRPLSVQMLTEFDFQGVDIAFFSAGSNVSVEYVPKAVAAGAIVIDNTSEFRYDNDVPLVVPQVNPLALSQYKKRCIISNPNCSTIQMVVALKPIFDAVGIKRINVCTYQAVSGTGKAAIDELAAQTAQVLNGQSIEANIYPQQIAFNALPHIDDFQENAYTKEEMKMVWETRKIFGEETILVNPTAVRIPVFYGHCEAVHIETGGKISAQEVRGLLRAAPGIEVIDDPDNASYPTAVHHAAGEDLVFVGRIREDISHPMGINMWIVADNIRKGAALNSIEIAEILVKSYL